MSRPLVALLLAVLVGIHAGAAGAHPTETIECGETLVRVLGSSPAELAVTALPGEVLSITAVALPGVVRFTPRWRLIDVEDHAVLLTNGSHHCFGRCETTPLPDGGAFTLRISDTGVGVGSYSVTVEAVSATANGASNGPPTPTCERPAVGMLDGTRPIVPDQPVNGLIAPPGETDTFTFVADAGDMVQAEISAIVPLPGFTPVWEAFDATGERVPLAGGASQCASACETAPLATGGVVTILVADDGNDASGGYTLVVGHHPETTTTV